MSDYTTIKDNIVIKTGQPELMRIEVEKTTRAYQIAEQYGVFQVPKILDYDEPRGQVKFEFIPGLQNIRQAVTSESVSKPIMQAAGAALAIIHKYLTLPENMRVLLPKAYQLNGTDVFLHGDFGLANVQVISGSRRIAILDWQSTRKLSTESTYGSRYFDLMCFVYNLFYRPIGRKRYKMAAPAAPMANEFLCGYFENSDFACDRAQMRSYMHQFLKVRLSDRKNAGHWKRRLLLIPSHIRLRKYANSCDFKGKSTEVV